MQSSLLKAAALAGVIGGGVFVVMQAQKNLAEQQALQSEQFDPLDPSDTTASPTSPQGLLATSNTRTIPMQGDEPTTAVPFPASGQSEPTPYFAERGAAADLNRNSTTSLIEPRVADQQETPFIIPSNNSPPQNSLADARDRAMALADGRTRGAATYSNETSSLFGDAPSNDRTLPNNIASETRRQPVGNDIRLMSGTTPAPETGLAEDGLHRFPSRLNAPTLLPAPSTDRGAMASLDFPDLNPPSADDGRTRPADTDLGFPPLETPEPATLPERTADTSPLFLDSPGTATPSNRMRERGPATVPDSGTGTTVPSDSGAPSIDLFGPPPESPLPDSFDPQPGRSPTPAGQNEFPSLDPQPGVPVAPSTRERTRLHATPSEGSSSLPDDPFMPLPATNGPPANTQFDESGFPDLGPSPTPSTIPTPAARPAGNDSFFPEPIDSPTPAFDGAPIASPTPSDRARTRGPASGSSGMTIPPAPLEPTPVEPLEEPAGRGFLPDFPDPVRTNPSLDAPVFESLPENLPPVEPTPTRIRSRGPAATPRTEEFPSPAEPPPAFPEIAPSGRSSIPDTVGGNPPSGSLFPEPEPVPATPAFPEPSGFPAMPTEPPTRRPAAEPTPSSIPIFPSLEPSTEPVPTTITPRSSIPATPGLDNRSLGELRGNSELFNNNTFTTAAVDGPQQPEVKIEKDAPPRATLNEPLVYNIHVRNVGRSAAHQVIVEDSVPRGATLRGTNPEAVLDPRDNRLIWQLGTMQPGEERTIRVQVVPTQAGEIGSIATVRFEGRVASKTVITAPNLRLTLEGPDELAVGEKATYRFHLTNIGDGEAKEVVLRSLIPKGLHHPVGEVLDYDVGTLAPGQSRDVDLEVVARTAGPFTNSAIVTAGGKEQSKAAADFLVLDSRLAITRNAPARRFVGRDAPITTLVTNQSTNTLKGIVVVEKLAPGVIGVGKTEPEAQVDNINRTITWRIPQLGPQQSINLRYSLNAEKEAYYPCLVIAQDEAGNRAEANATLEVKGFPSLKLAMNQQTNRGGTVNVGEQVAVRLTIANQGTGQASNVAASLIIPPNLRLVHIKTSGNEEVTYSIDEDTNIVTFETIPSLVQAMKREYDIVMVAEHPGQPKLSIALKSNETEGSIREDEPVVILRD
ncbi:MAG: hypothetical protein R3C01_16935 [Planctomycetaceae bacterium]